MMRNRYNNDCKCPPKGEMTCPPKPTIGNGKQLRVNIKSVNGTSMDELYFVLRFSVYGSHEEIVLNKQQLYTAKGKYYALLNDKYFPDGWLMCDLEIFEPMPGWANGMKPSTLRCCTGKMIGNCYGMPYPMESCMMPNAKGYVNGFKVTFEEVDSLPEEDEEDSGDNGSDNNGGNDDSSSNDNNGGSTDNTPTESTEIYYGIIRGLSAFNAITSEQLAGLTKLTSKPSGITNVNVTAGDTLVVVTNGASVMKDDGVGGKTTFDTSIMGANGEDLTLDGKSYKVYGETFIVSGTTGFYVV